MYDVCAHVCVMLMFWIGTLLWLQMNSLTFWGNMRICIRAEKMDTTRMFVRLICSRSQQPVSLAPEIGTRGETASLAVFKRRKTPTMKLNI